MASLCFGKQTAGFAQRGIFLPEFCQPRNLAAALLIIWIKSIHSAPANGLLT